MISETIVAMSTTNINRFKLKSTKVVSEKERYSEAKVKLNKMIDKHEVKADALSRHLITDKLLNDENIDCQVSCHTICHSCSAYWLPGAG